MTPHSRIINFADDPASLTHPGSDDGRKRVRQRASIRIEMPTRIRVHLPVSLPGCVYPPRRGLSSTLFLGHCFLEASPQSRDQSLIECEPCKIT